MLLMTMQADSMLPMSSTASTCTRDAQVARGTSTLSCAWLAWSALCRAAWIALGLVISILIPRGIAACTSVQSALVRREELQGL